MPSPFRFLRSSDRVSLFGSVDARLRAVYVQVLFGKRQVRGVVGEDGYYHLNFASSSRLILARVFAIDREGIAHFIQYCLIWHRPGVERHPVVDLAAAAAIIAPAFDTTHYLHSLTAPQRSLAATKPIHHYLTTGHASGLSPHPWFDPAWYTTQHADRNERWMPDVLHYVQIGWKQLDWPHPQFSPVRYTAAFPALLSGESCPLAHWLKHRPPPETHAPSPQPDLPRDHDGYYAQNHQYPHPTISELRARRDEWLRNRKPGNRVAFFTVIIGAYDTLRLPEYLSPDIDYHVFTDQPLCGYGVFKVHILPENTETDPTRKSRHPKLHPHVLLPGYDVVLFADANVIIRADLAPFISAFVASDRPLGLVPHPFRTCAYEEAAVVVSQGIDKPETVTVQMLAYENEGFPRDAGLTENNLYACRLTRPETALIFETWWNEITRGSRRDQLSAQYTLWKLGHADYFPLLGPGRNTRNHPAFALVRHGRYDAENFTL